MFRPAKIVCRVLWTACLISLLVGCVDLPLLSPREPVTIRFAVPGADGYLDPLIEEFQSKHKHITIEVVTDNIYRFEQLSDIDIILVPHFILPDLVEAGYPNSLDVFMQEDSAYDLDDIYPAVDRSVSVDGQRWAMPYMVDAMMMFYNRALFDRSGVPYPVGDWTWEEFLDRARLLSVPERGEYGFAYQYTSSQRDAELMLLIHRHGGQLYDDLESPTRMIFDDPVTVSALQRYSDLIYRHHVAPPPGQRTIPYPLQGIEEGKYAMWIGNFSDEWRDLNVGRVTLPQDQNAITFGTVLAFVISSRAQDPRACWEWVSYLSQHAPPALIPAKRSQLDVVAVSGGLNETEMAAVRVSMDQLIVLNPFQFGEFRTRSQKALQAYERALVAIQNGEPAEAAMSAAQQAAGY
jgi:ABC-type glycerol-3-phosphate transport system substrate-binding protein